MAKRKFTAAQRRAQRAFAKRAKAGTLKKGSKLNVKGKRRATKRTRRRGAPKRARRSKGRGTMVATKTMMYHAGAGAVEQATSGINPVPGLPTALVGVVTKNASVQGLGAYIAGANLVRRFGGSIGAGGSAGGFL